MYTRDRLICDDQCGAVFALRPDEGINNARRRAREDGWRWDGGDYCPSSVHRTRVAPNHSPLFGTETR